MRINTFFALILAALFIGWGGIIPLPAVAATFTVNDTADAVDASPGNGLCAAASGNCTLRAAVMEANALPGFHTIILPAGNYVLSLTGTNENNAASGDLDLKSNLIIRGDGAANTIIDGNATDRVFQVVGTITVGLIGLTITNGDPGLSGPGGGVYNNGGTLYLTNCVVISNISSQSDGGAIYNDVNSALFAIGTTFDSNSASGNGGAIYNAGFIQSEASVFSANTSLNGGGIYNAASGDLTVIQNSFVGNLSSGTGTSGGGGIFNEGLLTAANSTLAQNGTLDGGHGGALYHNEVTGTLTTLARLTNVTIGENTAAGNGGGIYNLNRNTEGLLLVNVTLNLNSATLGGGLYNAGQASLLNTILANSTGGNCSNSSPGTITSLGHNLDSGNTCGFVAAGDISSQDPLLLGLDAYGGPTLTYALDTTSPAVNTGISSLPPYTNSLTTDQRLYPRDAIFDIGAYEFAAENNASADLAISKTVSQNPVIKGRPFSYTITVTNLGPSLSTFLSIDDFLPAGVTLNSLWASQGICSGTDPIICDLGTLNPTTYSAATVILNVTAPDTAAGTISNTATVFAGAEPDPILNNNSAFVNTTIIDAFLLHLPVIFKSF